MKYSYIIVLLVFNLLASEAQQLSQFSQYLENKYLINPAATDIQNNLSVNLGYRNQWTGFPGKTGTFYLTAYAPLKKPDPSHYMQASMRLSSRRNAQALKLLPTPTPDIIAGLIVTNDNFGLYKKTTTHVSLGVHMPLTRFISLSVAPKIGLVNLNLQKELFVLEENDIPFRSFIDQFQNATFMDIGMGVWLYSDKFFLGYSMEQLLRNQNTSPDQTSFEFLTHHFYTAGIRLRSDQPLKIVPSILIRTNKVTPSSIDVGVRLEYQDRIWSSVSVRRSKAVITSFGLFLSQKMKATYSYDWGYRDSGREYFSAHEITLSLFLLENLHPR